MSGMVYLVGAGPGDAGLCTLRGRACLEEADVVVYDRLLSPRLLTYAPKHAQLIYVGKEADAHTMPQEQISQLLVKLARSGLTVVRLKGGDPFVFGRGGEEAQVLEAHGILWEVIPGVSSSTAVPAYAGIPVTHRGLATQFTVMTGHLSAATVEGKSADKEGTRGGTLGGTRGGTRGADDGTVVILMGVRQLPQIVEMLRSAGRAGNLPVALIRWGTTAGQEILTATVDTVIHDVQLAQFGSPAVFVAGEVVNLQSRLSWLSTRQLTGHRLLVATDTEVSAERIASRLELRGAEVVPIAVERFGESQYRSSMEQYLQAWNDYADGHAVSAIWAETLPAWRFMQEQVLGPHKLRIARSDVFLASAGTIEAVRDMHRTGYSRVTLAPGVNEWITHLQSGLMDEVGKVGYGS